MLFRAPRQLPHGLRLEGEPREVARGVEYAPNSFYSVFSAAPGGALLYALPERRDQQLVRLDASGGQGEPIADVTAFRMMRLSPDRRTLAFERADPTEGYDVWLLDLATGGQRRLTLRGSVSSSISKPEMKFT